MAVQLKERFLPGPVIDNVGLVLILARSSARLPDSISFSVKVEN